MPGESVLIVDDNLANLELVTFLLEKHGYVVRTAQDGDAALEILETFHPALILMDIQLPGADGIEVSRRVRAGGKASGAAIVAFTAYAMKGDRERLLGEGLDGYISKPIDTSEFPRLVRSFLTARATRPAR